MSDSGPFVLSYPPRAAAITITRPMAIASAMGPSKCAIGIPTSMPQIYGISHTSHTTMLKRLNAARAAAEPRKNTAVAHTAWMTISPMASMPVAACSPASPDPRACKHAHQQRARGVAAQPHPEQDHMATLQHGAPAFAEHAQGVEDQRCRDDNRSRCDDDAHDAPPFLCKYSF